MCGIAGVVQLGGSRIPEDWPSFASRELRHRGPDDRGFLRWTKGVPVVDRRPLGVGPEPSTSFIHRRLSIIDPTETGWQPMSVGDGRHWIVFNGEIYNYVELRTELSKGGWTFRTESDTEVLLATLVADGPEALRHVVGMFSLAVLDTQRRVLLLARDPFGIKPLYVASDPGRGFAFSSEISPLLRLPWVSTRVNPQRAYDYLVHSTTDFGDGTLFADVRQLPAATYLVVDLRTGVHGEPVRYWRPSDEGSLDLSREEAADELRKLFLESVDLHMRSDVPVAAALSGGIDSSAIVMSIEHLGLAKSRFDTFTYVAEGEADNEETWADLVGSASGATMHKIRPDHLDLRSDFERLIRIQGEPFRSTSIYAQYRVFERVRAESVKVVLDGQGADELLAGYPIYVFARLAELLHRARFSDARRFWAGQSSRPALRRWTPLLARYLLPRSLVGPVRQLAGRSLVPGWLREGWFDGLGVRPEEPRVSRPPSLLAELERSTHETVLPALLRYDDRNSMAHSVESRVPFLTTRIAEFVRRLPADHLLSETGESKSVFRQAMRGIVPDPILDRRDKIGFVTPEADWLSKLQPWVAEVFDSSEARSIPVLDWAVVRASLDRLTSVGRERLRLPVWRWLNFVEWSRAFDVRFD